MITRSDYRDPKFYLNFTTKNHYSDKGLEIEKDSNPNIESLVLDVTPDDSKGIFRTRKMVVWDKRKNNYVQLPVGGSVTSKGKIRSESGKTISAKDKGKLYKSWVKKNKLEIGNTGDHEADNSLSFYRNDRDRSRFRYHKTNPNSSNVKDELKTPDQIEKRHKEEEKKKQKSNPHGKRKRGDSKSTGPPSRGSSAKRPMKKKRGESKPNQAPQHRSVKKLIHKKRRGKQTKQKKKR